MFPKWNNQTGLETPNWDKKLSLASKKDVASTSINPSFSFGSNAFSNGSLGTHSSSKLFDCGSKPRYILFQEIQVHTQSRHLSRCFSSKGNGQNSNKEKHVPVNNNKEQDKNERDVAPDSVGKTQIKKYELGSLRSMIMLV